MSEFWVENVSGPVLLAMYKEMKQGVRFDNFWNDIWRKSLSILRKHYMKEYCLTRQDACKMVHQLFLENNHNELDYIIRKEIRTWQKSKLMV